MSPPTGRDQVNWKDPRTIPCSIDLPCIGTRRAHMTCCSVTEPPNEAERPERVMPAQRWDTQSPKISSGVNHLPLTTPTGQLSGVFCCRRNSAGIQLRWCWTIASFFETNYLRLVYIGLLYELCSSRLIYSTKLSYNVVQATATFSTGTNTYREVG